MTASVNAGIRLSREDFERWERLAQQAGVTKNKLLVLALRAIDDIEPARPAIVSVREVCNEQHA